MFATTSDVTDALGRQQYIASDEISTVLYLAERAWCPWSVLGTSYVTSRCGAFDDDFEAARGWTRNPDGTDTATSGVWQRGNPESTSSSGPKQLGTVPSGSRALTTGLAAGSFANANDLDGRSTVRSAPIARRRRAVRSWSSDTCSPTARTRRRRTDW